MKTTTIIFVLAGVFGLLALVGLILVLKADIKGEKPDIGKGILKKAFYALNSIFLVFLVFSSTRPYSLSSEQKRWDKYKLPQINSHMQLVTYNLWGAHYVTTQRDSIYHSTKYLEFDLFFDIYSVEDKFVNVQENKLLTMKFITPSLLRDSSRLITIKTLSDFSNKLPVDTLTFQQFDSVLVDWGLYERTFNKINY